MESINKDIKEILEDNGIGSPNENLINSLTGYISGTVLKDIQASCMSVEKRVKTAISCPICEQNIKIHPYTLNRNVCELLIKACKIDVSGKKWFHGERDLGTTQKEGGTFAKLKHWGLIERKPNPKDPNKAIKGMWCVTVLAMEFIGQKVKLPSKVYLYNSKLISKQRDEISIVDAIGNYDDYAALMRKPL